MARTSGLYKIILVAAILDVGTGILSLIYSTLAWQLIALGVTTLTLILSIVYIVRNKKLTKSNVATVVIGSLDFATGLVSVLVMVLATQVLAVIASSLTLIKAIKIFVQTEKAQKIFDTAKPLIGKLMLKCAPALGAWVFTKLKTIRNKIKEGDKLFMEKLKEFFVKLGQDIRANKISLTETLLNGGVWGVLGYLVSDVEAVAIDVCGFNITPILSIIGFVLVEIGFQWESFGAFIARISPKLAKKLADRQAKADEKARAEAIAQMKKEKELALAQMEKEKEAEKKAKAAAEALAKKEAEEKELAEWIAKKEADKKAESITISTDNAKVETLSKPE